MNAYGLFAILAATFAIWGMVAVGQSKMSPNQKVLWFILVVIFPVVGPLIYYFIKVK